MSHAPHNPPPRRTALNLLITCVHLPVVLAAVVLIAHAATPLFKEAPSSASPPSVMEDVNWESPESSIYCLACHKDVSPAMARLDVEQGHSQNVVLSDTQQLAVAEMGGTVGPDGVLICMSCHKLGTENEHMLADTLSGSKLCEHCHPRQFTLIGTVHDLRTSAPDEQNRYGQTAESGGPCSACHLSHHYARDFEPSELDPDGRCIICHTIGRAAAEHARGTMEHPDAHCVVCHNPHDETNRHFLKKPASQVCLDCHDYAGGVGEGMHPLGKMSGPIPQALLLAGAEVYGAIDEITCLTCHSTHSSRHAPLLLMPADTNELCLTCHEQELAEMGADGNVPRHGQSPELTFEQREVVEGRGGRVGANGELLCVSCHKVHHAESPARLLVFRPRSEDACSACHPAQAGVVGTAHDLRTNFGNEPNVAGVTPREGGVCSGCHMAHRPARPAMPLAADAEGLCTSCHRPDGLAASMLEGNAGHPGATCVSCHNPHEHSTPDFRVKGQADLCRSCHAEQFSMVGGPHDRNARPEAWANHVTDETGEDGPCLVCHVAHGEKGTDLLRGETDVSSNHDSVCLSCHADAAWGAQTAIAAIHPRQIRPEQKRVPVELVPTDAAGQMRMGCRTCHDPHGGATPTHLARVADDEPTSQLCKHCHQDKRLIERTGHSAEGLAAAGFPTESCKPCHAMHANPNGAWGQMLSPRFLMAGPAAQQADDIQIGHEAAVPCLVCHHEGGAAPVREIDTHPPVALTNISQPDEPGYMPLFNTEGKPDPRGQITCRTCHLSHGQTALLEAAERNADLSPDDIRAARMQLRPFVAPNLCTQCHGPDARLKFLFFHNVKQRGG